MALQKSGKKTGKVTLAGSFGIIVEALVTYKFPLVYSFIPPGTITALVAGSLYGIYDLVKSKVTNR